MVNWLGLPLKVRVKVKVRVEVRVMVSVACENKSSPLWVKYGPNYIKLCQFLIKRTQIIPQSSWRVFSIIVKTYVIHFRQLGQNISHT